MNFEEKKVFLINTTVIFVIGLIVFLITKFMLSYLLPFVIGIILAYAVQKPAGYFSKRLKVKKGICAAFLAVLSYIIIVVLLVLIIWVIVSNISPALKTASVYFASFSDEAEKISVWLNNAMQDLNEATKNTLQYMLSESINSLTEKLSIFISSTFTTLIKSLPRFMISSIVTVVASCYLAMDFERLLKFFNGLIKPTTYKNILIIKDIVCESILKFGLGYSLLLLITFIELSIGLFVLNVKYALIIAAIISIIDLLPVLGTGTVLLPWAVISFIGGNTGFGFSIVVLYLVICIVRNFLEPKIIGKQIGVNPLLTLVAMFVGVKLSGILGMIILPLALIVIINFYKRQMAEEKGIPV